MFLDVVADSMADVFSDAQIMSTVVRFTPPTAEQYLAKYKYQGQRKLRRDHVLFLAAEMKAGHFKPTAHVALAMTPKGQYLINGQHTLAAMVESDSTYNLTVITYIVSSDEEIADLYTHYDIGRGRTPSDMYTAYGIQNEFPWGMHTFNHYGYALNLIERKFAARRRHRHNRTKMLEMMREWKELGLKYIGVVGEYNPMLDRKLLSAPCFSIGLMTMKYQPALATLFWQQVTSGDADPKVPSRVLRDSLMGTTLTSGFRRASSAKIICQEEALQMVAACWNAFYLGKQIVRPSTKSLEQHFFLQGVPEKETRKD